MALRIVSEESLTLFRGKQAMLSFNTVSTYSEIGAAPEMYNYDNVHFILHKALKKRCLGLGTFFFFMFVYPKLT